MTTENAPSIGISKDGWELIASEEAFTNYTLSLKGTMSAYVDGVLQGDGSDNGEMHELYRVTADAFEINLMSDGAPVFTTALYGDDAKVSKTEITMLFLAILDDYNNFSYDSESNAYLIKNAVINTKMTMIVNGELSDIKLPVTIEVKNGSASISEDGRIARLTCDYSQTMTMGDSTVKATGVTEWTFSDYMTTVVEPNDSAAE